MIDPIWLAVSLAAIAAVMMPFALKQGHEQYHRARSETRDQCRRGELGLCGYDAGDL